VLKEVLVSGKQLVIGLAPQSNDRHV